MILASVKMRTSLLKSLTNSSQEKIRTVILSVTTKNNSLIKNPLRGLKSLTQKLPLISHMLYFCQKSNITLNKSYLECKFKRIKCKKLMTIAALVRSLPTHQTMIKILTISWRQNRIYTYRNTSSTSLLITKVDQIFEIQRETSFNEELIIYSSLLQTTKEAKLH